METHAFDVIVIGAGIAGATCAASLAPTHRVALLEAEEAAGFHSTGRSAAFWILNYGPPDVRVLTGLSRAFFEHPPRGFAAHALTCPRAMVFLAPPEQRARLDAMLRQGIGLREASLAEIARRIPALRPSYAVAAAIEEDAFDLDVAAIHQGFLRQARAAGAVLALRHRAGRIAFEGKVWRVETSTGRAFEAPVVVNAAGAWADEVARAAGLAGVGLVPCRRTASIIDPTPWQVADWPFVNDVDHTWYVRPEARTRLLVSPADQTPAHAHDVQPEELDIATAVARMQQALNIEVRRVERSWAGLRSFTPDGSLAIGWDAAVPGFVWCAGQGGYGIQTAPAVGRMVADLIAGRDPGEVGTILSTTDPNRFAARMTS